MPEYHAVSGSAAEDLFIELFSDAFGAEKAGYYVEKSKDGASSRDLSVKKPKLIVEKRNGASGGRIFREISIGG